MEQFESVLDVVNNRIYFAKNQLVKWKTCLRYTRMSKKLTQWEKCEQMFLTPTFCLALLEDGNTKTKKPFAPALKVITAQLRR